jgi:hypothetical protein
MAPFDKCQKVDGNAFNLKSSTIEFRDVLALTATPPWAQ